MLCFDVLLFCQLSNDKDKHAKSEADHNIRNCKDTLERSGAAVVELETSLGKEEKVLEEIIDSLKG